MRGLGERALRCAQGMPRTGASWIVWAALLFGALAFAPSALAAMGPGSLDRPTGSMGQTGNAHNRTKWTVQVGDTVTGTIRNVTDANLDGVTEADVVIKSSVRGNVTVTGTKSGTTITFVWHVPDSACETMAVAYGPVGSNPTGFFTSPARVAAWRVSSWPALTLK